MNLLTISKIEFSKLLKKRISLSMLAILFIPTFYTYSILTDTPLLQMTPSGALDFSFGQWSLLGMTGLFQVIFSLVAVGAFSSEIDRGQIKMSVLRQCTRKKIVYAKVISLIAFMILCYFIYISFAILCYYLFVTNTSYGTGDFISQNMIDYGVHKFIFSGIFPLMDSLITVGVVFLCSLKYKSGTCFMLAIGTTTMLLIMQFFPGVQYLVPAYVGTLLDYNLITPIFAGALCLIYVFVIMTCIAVTAKKFERMDLK